jgi:hypothetical protein
VLCFFFVFAIVVVAWPVVAHEGFFEGRACPKTCLEKFGIFSMACSPPGDAHIALRIFVYFWGTRALMAL